MPGGAGKRDGSTSAPRAGGERSAWLARGTSPVASTTGAYGLAKGPCRWDALELTYISRHPTAETRDTTAMTSLFLRNACLPCSMHSQVRLRAPLGAHRRTCQIASFTPLGSRNTAFFRVLPPSDGEICRLVPCPHEPPDLISGSSRQAAKIVSDDPARNGKPCSGTASSRVSSSPAVATWRGARAGARARLRTDHGLTALG